METCKSLKQLIDAAYLRGFDDEGMSFVMVMDVCGGGRKMFYFHKAKVTRWDVSVFFPKDGPVTVVLESASGLRLVYHQNLGLRIVNTKRFKPSYRQGDVHKVHQDTCQSLTNHEVTFYEVN